SEGRNHLRTALQRSGLPNSAERGQALLGAARLAHMQFDLEEAESFGQESLEWFRARGDARGIAAPLLSLAEAAVVRDNPAAAECRPAGGLEASRQSGWTQGMALMHLWLGIVAYGRGDIARARSSLEEGRARAGALGDAPILAAAFHLLALLAA